MVTSGMNVVAEDEQQGADVPILVQTLSRVREGGAETGDGKLRGAPLRALAGALKATKGLNRSHCRLPLPSVS